MRAPKLSLEVFLLRLCAFDFPVTVLSMARGRERTHAKKRFLQKMMHPIVVDNNDIPLWIPNFRHNNCYINNNNEKITIKWQQN